MTKKKSQRKKKAVHPSRKKHPKQKNFEVTIALYNDVTVTRKIQSIDKETAIARTAFQIGQGKLPSVVKAVAKVIPMPKKESPYDDDDFDLE